MGIANNTKETKKNFGYMMVNGKEELEQYLSTHKFEHPCSTARRPAEEHHNDINLYKERVLRNFPVYPWTQPVCIVFYTEYVLPVSPLKTLDNSYKVIDSIYGNINGFRLITNLFDYEIELFNKREELKALPAMIYESYECALDDKTQYYPMVTQVVVKFTEDNHEEEVSIALLPMNDLEGRVNDDEIFFYVDGISELVKLTKDDNGEDFQVVGIKGYSHYPEPDDEPENTTHNQLNVASLTYTDSDNTFLNIGIWKSADLSEKLTEYFSVRFDEVYAEDTNDDYLAVSDKNEYVSVMVGRLLTKSETSDINASDILYTLSYATIEF